VQLTVPPFFTINCPTAWEPGRPVTPLATVSSPVLVQVPLSTTTDPVAGEAELRPPSNEDSELMRRVQGGDEASLGVLMNRWERPVKSVIARLVLNVCEADDLAQETFVHVWQHRLKFRPDAAFRPWIFSIAVNLARNRLRWWRRRPEVALDEWMETVGGNPEGAEPLARAERAAAVRDAIAALPSGLRAAIVLAEYEQLTQGRTSLAF